MCISFPILLFYPEIVKNERKPKDENITRHYISNPSVQPQSNESAKKMCYLAMLNLHISQIVLEFSEAI